MLFDINVSIVLTDIFEIKPLVSQDVGHDPKHCATRITTDRLLLKQLIPSFFILVFNYGQYNSLGKQMIGLAQK